MKPLILALPLLAALAACDGKPAATAAIAAAAPELAVLDQSDRAVKLAEFRGKIVLLTFWINGCGPCLAEMPVLDAVYRARKAAGFEILAVNTGQDPATIAAARRRVAVSFPFLSDRLSITSRSYAVASYPVSFLIDGQGIIRERIDGPVSRDDLDRKISALL
jgi:peroxiredoxin